FTGPKNAKKLYSTFTTKSEKLRPLKTTIGRQSYDVEYEILQQFGESLPGYKTTLPRMVVGTKDKKISGGQDNLVLRYLTPDGKWNIHSTYQDTQHMLTLFRGGPVVWLSKEDPEAQDINHNDWLEGYNQTGVVTAQAGTPPRMTKGKMFMDHAKTNNIQTTGTEITMLPSALHNPP
ncbi:molybdopterin dinucleotide binding domain-containing protein, partial [Staphylococcus simulans]